MKVNGCKYVTIILLLAKYLSSNFFLFKNGSGKFLVKQQNISSPAGCKDDTCLASSITKKIEILDEKDRKRRKDYVSNRKLTKQEDWTEKPEIFPQTTSVSYNEVCECGIANGHGEEKKNRILFPTEVKHHTYPWVVQIFLDYGFCK